MSAGYLPTLVLLAVICAAAAVVAWVVWGSVEDYRRIALSKENTRRLHRINAWMEDRGGALPPEVSRHYVEMIDAIRRGRSGDVSACLRDIEAAIAALDDEVEIGDLPPWEAEVYDPERHRGPGGLASW